MLLNIATSISNPFIISDFQYIYDLARCSKCQMFILLKSTNKLYGASDDCCCIHEIDVPFLVNTDLMFRIDSIDKDMIKTYANYFIPDKFNWVILPDYYWNMYIAGDLISEYDYDKDQNIILDKTTKNPIEQIQMQKSRSINDYGMQIFIKQLEGLLIRKNTLGAVNEFCNIHEDDNIRKAFDNKAAIGRVLCRMTNNNIDVLFYFYKGMFSLAKADSLDLEIRFDNFDNRAFMATFKPKKKKNPLNFNTYGVSFQEKIHCMFMNII